jgi:hypothetical protein
LATNPDRVEPREPYTPRKPLALGTCPIRLHDILVDLEGGEDDHPGTSEVFIGGDQAGCGEARDRAADSDSRFALMWRYQLYVESDQPLPSNG